MQANGLHRIPPALSRRRVKEAGWYLELFRTKNPLPFSGTEPRPVLVYSPRWWRQSKSESNRGRRYYPVNPRFSNCWFPHEKIREHVNRPSVDCGPHWCETKALPVIKLSVHATAGLRPVLVLKACLLLTHKKAQWTGFKQRIFYAKLILSKYVLIIRINLMFTDPCIVI
jgi:hypothetical protein